MLQIYGIKNCDSVKKAIKYLKENSIEYNLVDFKTTPVNIETIREWLEFVDIDTIFNKRSTTYRNLKLKDKNLTDEEKLHYLAEENLLIKRPIIKDNNNILVGYNISKYQENITKG
jgi:Spx/MgsR family transcriptional regulator